MAGNATLCVASVHAVESEGVVFRLGEVLAPKVKADVVCKFKVNVRTECAIVMLFEGVGFVPLDVAHAIVVGAHGNRLKDIVVQGLAEVCHGADGVFGHVRHVVVICLERCMCESIVQVYCKSVVQPLCEDA